MTKPNVIKFLLFTCLFFGIGLLAGWLGAWSDEPVTVELWLKDMDRVGFYAVLFAGLTMFVASDQS